MTEYIYGTDDHEGHWLTGEEIVRCRDCEHFHDSVNGCDEFGDEWNGMWAIVEPDGFCAWALRKGESK